MSLEVKRPKIGPALAIVGGIIILGFSAFMLLAAPAIEELIRAWELPELPPGMSLPRGCPRIG